MQQEFAERRDIELNARNEIEDLNKQLRIIEKSKLQALEKDKVIELQRLAAERQAIQLKEKALLDEIEHLKVKVVADEKKFEKDATELQRKVNNAQFIKQYRQEKQAFMVA